MVALWQKIGYGDISKLSILPRSQQLSSLRFQLHPFSCARRLAGRQLLLQRSQNPRKDISNRHCNLRITRTVGYMEEFGCIRCEGVRAEPGVVQDEGKQPEGDKLYVGGSINELLPVYFTNLHWSNDNLSGLLRQGSI